MLLNFFITPPYTANTIPFSSFITLSLSYIITYTLPYTPHTPNTLSYSPPYIATALPYTPPYTDALPYTPYTTGDHSGIGNVSLILFLILLILTGNFLPYTRNSNNISSLYY